MVDAFTVDFSRGGFTDQLLQLSAFYRLGRSLGLPYVHRPFISRRSLPLDGAVSEVSGGFRHPAEFLGLERWFQERWPSLEDAPTPVRQVLLGGDQLLTLEDVQEHLHPVLNSSEPGTLEFKLNRGRHFFTSVFQALPNWPDAIDLHRIYVEQRQRSPWPTVFEPGKLRILIHIRQGDTAVIPTPWGTFIPQWDARRTLAEHDSFEAVGSKLCLPVSAFSNVVRRLLSQLPAGSYSAAIFSDGFLRASNTMTRFRDKVALSDERLDQLIAHLPELDRQEFMPLSNLPDTKLFVGERPEYLFSLLDALMGADVVVTGTQQRMIPKLLVNLKPEARPVLFVVKRVTHPEGVFDRGLEQLSTKFLDARKSEWPGAEAHLNRLVARPNVRASRRAEVRA